MSINQMMRGYDYYKAKYEQIKPIRGRATEVKPLGKRSRDWETVTKNGDVYSAKLYQTECVRYHPNGDIQLRCETYSTPITADFIHTHSPFYSYKKYNKLWVHIRSNKGGEDRVYPIPEGDDGLTLRYVGEGENYTYEPTVPVVVEQEVVDRQKAKDARKPMKPFLDWARMINKLSDGWIMNETREQFGTLTVSSWRGEFDYGLPKEVFDKTWWGSYEVNPEQGYKYISECDPEQYMSIYLCLLSDVNKGVDKKLAKSVENTNPQYQGHKVDFYDVKYNYDTLKRIIYKMVENAVDTKKKVKVEVGGKAITNIVG